MTVARPSDKVDVTSSLTFVAARRNSHGYGIGTFWGASLRIAAGGSRVPPRVNIMPPEALWAIFDKHAGRRPLHRERNRQSPSHVWLTSA